MMQQSNHFPPFHFFIFHIFFCNISISISEVATSSENNMESSLEVVKTNYCAILYQKYEFRVLEGGMSLY